MVTGDEYRFTRIEDDIEEIKEDLKEKYLDKYQLMNDYLSKVENEKMLNTRHTRLLTVTTCACTVAALINVGLAMVKVI